MSEFNPLDRDFDGLASNWPGLDDSVLRLASSINAAPIHIGDTLTWESKPKPWSIWRFWRKAKPAQLNTFVVTSVT